MRIYRLVDSERAHHAVSLLCSVLGVSRQAYYAWRARVPSARELRDRELKALIGEVFVESRRTYGAPRIAKRLRRRRGQPVATKRVARLMRELGLEGLSRGKKGRGTTVRDPAAAGAPDLVKRDFTAAAPDRASRDIARLRIFDYIEAFYNPLRMHTTLGDLSPDEYEAAYHATLTEADIAA